MTILLIFLSLGSNVFALDSKSVTKGEVVPFDGVIFNNTNANVLRVRLLERDTYLQLNSSYEESFKLTAENFKLKDEQIKLLGDNNLRLTKELRSEREIGTWERLGWFTLGVIATSSAVYGVKKITN